jgi:hypothetical protein
MNKIFSIIAVAILGLTMQVNAQTIKQAKIEPITNSLATIIDLNPVYYSYDKNWLDKLQLKPSQSGFNFEELTKINPNLVVRQQLNYNEGKNINKTAVNSDASWKHKGATATNRSPQSRNQFTQK